VNWHPDIPLNVTDAAGAAWLVRRAWPEAVAGDYILELLSLAGRGVRAGHLRQGAFDLVPEEDPKLPSLRRAASKGVVVVHRAHKRAVVHSGNHFIKVFRPGRAPHAAERHTIATGILDGGLFDTPRMVVGSGSDVLVFSGLLGRSYFELGQDHSALSDASFAAKWHEWGKAWAGTVALSGGTFRSMVDRLPLHPPEVEAENLRRWSSHWMDHSEGIPEAAAGRTALRSQAEMAIARLMATPHDPLGWAHGDLHDKQIIGDEGFSQPGLLDFDESCQAEAALDLANLDVHLELRHKQKLLTPRRYAIAHRQILAAAEVLQVRPQRFAAYAACTRLRLACMYCFRPPWGGQAAQYLSQGLNYDCKDPWTGETAKAESSRREWSLT
jgi:hypothetical protein